MPNTVDPEKTESRERKNLVNLPDDFYERIKGRLRRRICRELRPAGQLLDLGCGSCELEHLLAEQNGTHVIGVDISDEKFPDSNSRSDGVECRKADAGNLDFAEDRSMDAVVCVYALHEIAEPLNALKEARRVLRKQGRILIVDFPRDSLAQRLWNEQYYTWPQVASMLRRCGFVEVQARTIFQDQLIWALARAPDSACSDQPPDATAQNQ